MANSSQDTVYTCSSRDDPAARADNSSALCPLHVTRTCSRIAVPAAAFASPPPLPFVANTSAFADIGDVSVAAPWRSPRPYALIPGAGCDTGHVSMPTAPFETQLFSPAQRVGHTPQPAVPPFDGPHSWRQYASTHSRWCAHPTAMWQDALPAPVRRASRCPWHDGAGHRTVKVLHELLGLNAVFLSEPHEYSGSMWSWWARWGVMG